MQCCIQDTYIQYVEAGASSMHCYVGDVWYKKFQRQALLVNSLAAADWVAGFKQVTEDICRTSG